jgi:para-nitrobenzyl esterase
MKACGLLLAATTLSGAIPAQPPNAPTVTTKCGQIDGATDAVQLNGVTKAYSFRYSAIPYAAPPLGQLRWRPPQSVACPWPGVRNSSVAPNSCIHPDGSGSEDCLYLSVVSPAPLPANPLPVLVWFHGGNLIGGSISNMNGNEVLATQAPGGVIVVAVAYRLGVIGWLSTPDLAAEQGGAAGNYGVQVRLEERQRVVVAV